MHACMLYDLPCHVCVARPLLPCHVLCPRCVCTPHPCVPSPLLVSPLYCYMYVVFMYCTNLIHVCLRPIQLMVSPLCILYSIYVYIRYTIYMYIVYSCTVQTAFTLVPPPRVQVMVSPLVVAGWCGMITQALALLPVGCTDGGRMVQAAHGKNALALTSFFTYLGLGLGLLGSSLALPYGLYVIICQRTAEKYILDNVTPAGKSAFHLELYTIVLLGFHPGQRDACGSVCSPPCTPLSSSDALEFARMHPATVCCSYTQLVLGGRSTVWPVTHLQLH